jgi:ER membrane protein complex subunit 2
MLSCLQTGDEQSAYLCLEKLTSRFGAENDRLVALRGLFKEAMAKDEKALQLVLEEYESILSRDATNTV